MKLFEQVLYGKLEKVEEEMPLDPSYVADINPSIKRLLTEFSLDKATND